MGLGGAEGDVGLLHALSSCGCGSDDRQARVSIRGSRGAGSRRCQELRRLALVEREEKAPRPATAARCSRSSLLLGSRFLGGIWSQR